MLLSPSISSFLIWVPQVADSNEPIPSRTSAPARASWFLVWVCSCPYPALDLPQLTVVGHQQFEPCAHARILSFPLSSAIVFFFYVQNPPDLPTVVPKPISGPSTQLVFLWFGHSLWQYCPSLGLLSLPCFHLFSLHPFSSLRVLETTNYIVIQSLYLWLSHIYTHTN